MNQSRLRRGEFLDRIYKIYNIIPTLLILSILLILSKTKTK